MRILFLPLISLMVLLAACSSVDCSINNKVNCIWNIVYADGDDVTPNYYITLTSVRSSDGEDTIMVNLQQNAKTLSLPVSYVQEEDVMHFWVFQDPSTFLGYDEIKVTKTNTPVFESVDCDTRYNHKITSVATTHNFIDSVVVINADVTNIPSNENIRIYLHPAQ